MLIEQFTLQTSRGTTKKALKLQCDTCGKVFERTYNVKVQAHRVEHWCSAPCFALAFKSGGSADVRKRATNIERYGIAYVINNPIVASIAGKAAHTPEIEKRRWSKIHEGWKTTSVNLKRGLSLVRSRTEIEFFERLAKSMGTTIECPKYINRWFIDGYIAKYDAWVQFDGVYWHSRPERIVADQKQNTWFKEQGLKLFRITDQVYLKKPGILEVLILQIQNAVL